eukprot:1157652-Pelagomonas_calceolata.AAC.10
MKHTGNFDRDLATEPCDSLYPDTSVKSANNNLHPQQPWEHEHRQLKADVGVYTDCTQAALGTTQTALGHSAELNHAVGMSVHKAGSKQRSQLQNQAELEKQHVHRILCCWNTQLQHAVGTSVHKAGSKQRSNPRTRLSL